jgi:hypothetical protein
VPSWMGSGHRVQARALFCLVHMPLRAAGWRPEGRRAHLARAGVESSRGGQQARPRYPSPPRALAQSRAGSGTD